MTAHLDKLAPDIQWQIVNLLQEKDRQSLRTASKYWFTKFTEHVYIFLPPPNQEAWKRLLARRPNIRSIRFEISTVDPLILSFMPAKLEKLDFFKTRVSSRALNQLAGCHSLRELTLRKCPNVSLETLSLTQLRSITLSSSSVGLYTKKCFDQRWKKAEKIISERFGVKTIYFNGPGEILTSERSEQEITDENKKEILQIIEGVYKKPIPTPAFFKEAKSLKVIQEVGLFSSVGNKTTDFIFKILRKFPPTREIAYNGSVLNRMGWFSSLTRLNTLSLDCCGPDKGFHHLSKLKSLTKLITIGSPQNQQVHALSGLTNLRVLYFHPGQNPCFSTLKSLTHLTELGIENSYNLELDFQGLTALKQVSKLYLQNVSINPFPHIGKLPLNQLMVMTDRGSPEWKIPQFHSLHHLALSIGNLTPQHIKSINMHKELRTLSLDTIPRNMLHHLGSFEKLKNLYLTTFTQTTQSIDCSFLNSLHNLERLAMGHLVKHFRAMYGTHSPFPTITIQSGLPLTLKEVRFSRLFCDENFLHAISKLTKLRILAIKPEIKSWTIEKIHLTWLKKLTSLEKLHMKDIGSLPINVLSNLKELKTLKWGMIDKQQLPVLLSLPHLRTLRFTSKEYIRREDLKNPPANLWSVNFEYQNKSIEYKFG